MRKQVKYNKLFKESFVHQALKKVFTSLTYYPDKGIDKNVIASTGSMRTGDIYQSNDLIIGRYKKIGVVQADVKIREYYTDSDGDRNIRTIFLGRWMIFEFNKNFKANIRVCEKSFSNASFFYSGKQIKMEDAEFNKKFRINATDEHEAFYILTPALMEKIKTLNHKINGNLLLCFHDNFLHVGLQNNQDSFEFKLKEKIDIKELENEVLHDIRLITAFIDELDLDNHLFKTGAKA